MDGTLRGIGANGKIAKKFRSDGEAVVKHIGLVFDLITLGIDASLPERLMTHTVSTGTRHTKIKAHLPILAFPGTLCDRRLFEPLELALGRTFIHAEPHHANSISKAAADGIDEAPPRFVALGFSLGGWIALELLRLAPDRVAAVILISGNALPDDPANHEVRRASVQTARDIGMKAYVRGNLPSWVDARFLASADFGAVLLKMAERVGHDGHQRQAEMNINRPDLLAVVDNASVPILLLAGAEDQLCPSERYARTAAGPRVQLITLPGLGHFLPLEAPSVVAAAVAQFLKSIEL